MSGDNPLIDSNDLWNDAIYGDVEAQLIAQGYDVAEIQALFSGSESTIADFQSQVDQIVADGREGYVVVDTVADGGEEKDFGVDLQHSDHVPRDQILEKILKEVVSTVVS